MKIFMRRAKKWSPLLMTPFEVDLRLLLGLLITMRMVQLNPGFL